ncbi:MAG: kinase/pyrophosphorylase [Geminicoccaceae bacterium]
MRHDDGQGIDDLENAGRRPARRLGTSSATPTCVYLAHRGIRAANVPIDAHAQLEHLEKLRRPLVVGLTISPDALVQIRRQPPEDAGRKHGDVGRYGGDYADLVRIREELVLARRMLARHRWPGDRRHQTIG